MTDSGRILGLDVGERRIGVAISDPDRRFALPLNSIVRERGVDPFQAIEAVARGDEVTEIVVGLPLSLSGEAGRQAESVSAFADELGRRLGLTIHLWDERLSTQEALRRVTPGRRPSGGRRARGRAPVADTDALAASIILQAYLDSLHGGANRWPNEGP